MPTLQKVAMAIVGVALVTTLVYPGHQTAAVLGPATRLVTGTLSTAEGTSAGAVS
jgi:hypothetical protein